MTHRNYSTSYIQYANTACKVIAPFEWQKYLKKLYESSTFLTCTDSRPCVQKIASLTIQEKPYLHTTLKLLSHPRLSNYKIIASPDPLFLYPSVHQIISRILNIMFHLSGGFVLHSSAIHINNKTFLFVGESGRGKTTIIDMLHKHKKNSYILCDNSAFIRQIDGLYVVFPSPYLEANRIGTIQNTIQFEIPCKIDTVYFPYHASHTVITKLNLSERLKLIQKNSHIPYDPKVLFNKKESKIFGRMIFQFIHSVEMYKLGFVNNESFMYHIS